MSKSSITFIKLGGSIITDKEQPKSLRIEILQRLIEEIVRAKKTLPNELFVIGHGAGSFAHPPAAKYKTMDGFINEESQLGMAKVQDAAAQLNRIVVEAFLNADQPAVTLAASNMFVTANRVAQTFCIDVCEEYLDKGLLPITSGDVLVDVTRGCTIWSSEEILAFWAKELVKKNWLVNQIIHVAEVPGFYDLDKEVVPHISSQTWPELQHALTTTKGFDVTGGMGLKVEESLRLAQIGIESRIISGLVPDTLYKALTHQPTIGTRIYDK